MKLELTSLQSFTIHSVLRDASEVLREVKRKKLKGEALQDMKMLEAAVQHLECFVLGK